MSWLLDSMRNMVGIPTTGNSANANVKSNPVLERRRAAASAPEAESFDNRAAAFARAQNLKMRQLEHEINKVNQSIEENKQRGNWNAVKLHLEKKKMLEKDLNVMQMKHKNIVAQQSAIQTAHSNLEQGLLVEQGANELSSAVSAMNEINLDDAVDKMQDAAGEMQEHNHRLTEPLLGFGDAMVDAEEVDEEVERMRRQFEEEQAAKATINLPDVKFNTHVPVPTPTAATKTNNDNNAVSMSYGQTKQEAVNEEIDPIKN